MKKSIRLSARAFVPALSVLSLAVAASVQAQVIEVNPVVISASRMEQPLSDVLSSVSVITRADIDKSQAASLADLLQGEAGYEFGRNGGPGTTTSFFMRGEESRNVVVLIDGVKAQTDALGAIQTTDFPLQQVERVEILKGNASALYGNAAIGGVINIITRQNKGAPKAYGSVSAGSYKTTGAFAGYGGTLDDVNFDLNVGRDKSAGFSAMNTTQNAYVNPDRDGYQREYAAAKFEKRISADTQISTRMNYSVLNVDYDSGYRIDLPTDVHKFKTTSQSVSGYVRQAINENWVSNVSLTRSEYKYDDTKNGVAWPSGGWDNSYFRGWQNALAWNNTYQLQSQTKAVFGADLTNDTFNGSGSQSSSYALTRHSQGYFAGLTHQIDRLTVQTNVRHDQLHLQQEGSSPQSDNQANTGLLGLGYQLAPAWKLTGTVSTGFGAPTAAAVSTNPNIKPEHHHSQEVGAVYQTNESLLRAVYFQKKATDAIIYNIAGDYVNGDIDNKGVELTARTNAAGYSVKSSVTVQDPRDIVQNLPQARRAKRYGSLDVSRTLSGYDVGSRLYAASARRDSNWSAGTGYDLSGYSTLAFYVSRKIDNEWTARVKLENAFNRDYQLASGYNTPGRGVYATLQYQPK
jgi:vitamin B12 transporter